MSIVTLVGVVLSNGYVLAWFKRMLPSLWPRPGGAVDPQNKAEIGQSEDVLGSPESTQSTPALLIAVAEAPEPKSDCVVDVIVGGIRGERRLVPICSIGSGRAGFPVSAPHYTTWKFVYDESDGDKEGKMPPKLSHIIYLVVMKRRDTIAITIHLLSLAYWLIRWV
ncbi:hypothetical protein FQN55_007761 [Onygenales sp. PD_40]|nr:hypothetical protein FQN55_007761 [Onygenales sp. PD_40]